MEQSVHVNNAKEIIDEHRKTVEKDNTERQNAMHTKNKWINYSSWTR